MSDTDVVTFPYVDNPEIVTLAVILPLLCLSTVFLRFYARVSNGFAVGIDDWLMVPGALLYVGMCICLLIGCANNVFGRSDPIDPSLPSYLVPRSEILAKLFYAFQILLVIAFGFVKCSIVALYRRIFVTEKNTIFDITCKVMTGVIISWSITFFVIVNLSCGPHISHFWGTKTEQATTCETFTPTRGLAGTDMVIDVALMLLPQPLIWRLGLSWSKKLVISVLIALGCACIGADIAQTVLFGQIARASELGIPLEQNRIVALVMYYTCIDGGLAVTAACLVTLRPLFRNSSAYAGFQGLRSRFSKSSSSSSKGGKLWDSTGSTESSSGTQTGDVEKATPLYVVDRGVPVLARRPSESKALAYNQYGYAEGKVMSSVDIKQVEVRPKRGSESVALSPVDRCGNCGH